MPYPVYASFSVAPVSGSPASGCTTMGFGRLYFIANSKSRWSCAGTAMIAPVPYSSSTKFPTQMGTFAPPNGFRAYRPVKKPSFSAAARSAVFTDICRICASLA